MLCDPIRIIVLFAIIITTSSALALNPRTTRISNGEATNLSRIPYQVTLEKSTGDRFRQGGILISDRFVLTSASGGIRSVNASELTVRVGSNLFGKGGTVSPASRIIIHENYSLFGNSEFPGFMINDIAIIELDHPILAESFAKPIKMFEAGEKVRPNATGIVSGWILNETSASPLELTRITVSVVSRGECMAMFSKWGGSIAEGKICAEAIEPDGPDCFKDVGDEDSGSPLAVDGKLLGIASWGTPFSRVPNTPGVYTEVSYYRDWIKKHTGL